MSKPSGSLSTDIRPLVRRLGKTPEKWQREDLVRFCFDNGIRTINFRYPALDGKLKELRLPANDEAYLNRILAAGERVDGSSLFPTIFDSGASDLYVIPVYRWAFLNPWADDELDIVCRFADQDGKPCRLTPDNLLANVAESLREKTGYVLNALAELEFYLILERADDRFTGKAQRNYHQSGPYLHGGKIVDDIVRTVSAVTGGVKYCHSEVGYIDRIESHDPEINGRRVEQYELEFDLMPIEDLGCWLTVARWLVRVIADRHRASVTYLPKLDQGMAGSGMHIHLALEKDGRNVMLDESGQQSNESLKLIGGILRHASPLTPFGNCVAASYLRLVPGHEAPTRICWGSRNRSGLLRVPLSFLTPGRMDKPMNPNETGDYPDSLSRPTVEYRSPDGSAFSHLLLAGITICIEDGLLSEYSLPLAKELEIEGNVFSRPELVDRLVGLPPTAVQAAASLSENRAFFEERGYPARLLDVVIRKLETENDEGLNAKLRALPASERLVESRRLMHKDLHKH